MMCHVVRSLLDPGFKGSSQHLRKGFAVSIFDERQEAIQLLRGKIRSPGRPVSGFREQNVRAWEADAGGAPSEDAGGRAGVSMSVDHMWFREAGGILDPEEKSGCPRQDSISAVRGVTPGFRPTSRWAAATTNLRPSVLCTAPLRHASAYSSTSRSAR